MRCYAEEWGGSGDETALVGGGDGKVTAQYEYGPFGDLARATGSMAKVNPFRFSTKYYGDETDLFYYGYRYYNASTGRWAIRDPIGEGGFELLRTEVRARAPGGRSDLEPGRPSSLRPQMLLANLTSFVGNSPVASFDPLG